MHEVNCRNFKCPSSDGKGGCRQSRVELTPVGGIIDRLICINCTRNAEPVEREPPVEPPRSGAEFHEVS